MKHYTYHFSDGTKSTVEVTDEMYETLTEMDACERKNNRTETRRHISVSVLSESNIEILALDEDLSDLIIAKENISNLQEAIKSLTADEQNLVRLYYFDNLTLEVIAQKYGVQKPAISKRLSRILRKLKKVLQTMETYPHSRGI